MKISIDASNIKAGGGLTHLKRIIEYNHSDNLNLKIIGGERIGAINDKKNVEKIILSSELNSILKQEFFKRFRLANYLSHADIAYIPGGTFSSKKLKYVSMSQNMLVFESQERNRFPKSITWLRYLMLERLQLKSFKNASGIIYISNYAKNYIEKKYPILKNKKSTVIYHGISDDFRQKPKIQQSVNSYTKESPLKLLYVSIVNFYKHQWNVIEAVKTLRNKGYNISLELIGPVYEPARPKLEKALIGTKDYIFYKGKVDYDDISKSYKNADIFIFASTCENMPNILVEAMSAGLPILSSHFGPMPEILRDAGVYMDPTDIENIKENLETLIIDSDLRNNIAEKAYNYSLNYSWQRTAKETFGFLHEIYQENKR